ncbi:MAG: methyltransferase [Halieaceae bacterium]|jgi:protein-S-isoprenylcysteine O-methyltransferase Ste14|nr:methyltransferase [Halieaceae bacterium]
MKRFAVFTYALLSYAIGMGGLVVFMLYQGDLLLPRTVNTAPTLALAAGLALNCLLILLWGVQHSLMARPRFKQWFTRFVPEAAERATYVLASGLCLLAIAAWWQGNSAIAWHLPDWQLPLRVLSLLGWGIAVWATFQIDHFDLFGLKQPYCELVGRNYTQRSFVTPFLYRHVRHPIQTGIMIGIWCQALMTAGQLLLTVAMTVYVFIGLYYEERDLVTHFGNRYRSYMQQVPRLFPRPGKRISGTDIQDR